MKSVNIDGLTLTEKMVEELNVWYSQPGNMSQPEEWTLGLDEMKNTFINIMCDDSNDRFIDEIKDALRLIIVIQDSFKKLIPEN